MKELLLQYITEEYNRKKAANIVPPYTTAIQATNALNTSREQIKTAAKVLEYSGKIRIGRTISDDYYEVVMVTKVNDDSERRVLPADQP